MDAAPRPGRLRRTPAASVHLGSMLALTFATGIIDAVGYLGLDRVFTGNMTGNVVLLGMALTGTTNLPILRPLLALGAFLVGAVVGSRLVRRDDGWSGRVTATLWVIAGLLTAIAVLLAPLTVGTLADATSLTAAFGLVPVALALAAAGLLLVRRAQT